MSNILFSKQNIINLEKNKNILRVSERSLNVVNLRIM